MDRNSTISKYHLSPHQIKSEYEEIKEAITDSLKFEVLYNRYHEQIFRFIFQRVSDKELAFDITSQVFLKAMLNLKNYKFQGVPFSSWLYRVASNELNREFNRNSSCRVLNIESAALKDIAEEVEEISLGDVYQAELITAITELSESDRNLVEMRFFDKLSFKQISEVLEITEPNAKMKLYRILDKLKKIIIAKGCAI